MSFPVSIADSFLCDNSCVIVLFLRKSLGHSLKGIGNQLGISGNLDTVTARYVDVRLNRKLAVLNAYHEAVLGEK